MVLSSRQFCVDTVILTPDACGRGVRAVVDDSGSRGLLVIWLIRRIVGRPVRVVIRVNCFAAYNYCRRIKQHPGQPKVFSECLGITLGASGGALVESWQAT